MFNEELEILLKAKTRLIWIKTDEETRAIANIALVMKKKFPGKELSLYSVGEGIKRKAITSFEEQEGATEMSPNMILKAIGDDIINESAEKIYVLKDFHPLLSNFQLLRTLKDKIVMEKELVKSYIPIIIIAPVLNIPNELDKIVTVLEFNKPNKIEIELIFGTFDMKVRSSNKGYGKTTKKELARCVELARGLTEEEIHNYIARSLMKYNKISEEIFYQARIDLIKKTDVLEYEVPNLTLEDMGGNETFKDWIEEVKLGYEDGAKEFGVEKSKGCLSLGVAGTAKTLGAEMIASELKLPLLKFNINKVLGSLVGQTEQNTAKALEVIKACSPCVLLIDEVEKSLSGSNSGVSDGGAMRRVIGNLLNFMSDKDSEDIFTVMTSNDSSQLPPELMRSGRLDTIWFFGLPSLEEREEIFRIHFSKTPIKVSDELISSAALNSDKFTGAEIKEVVKTTMRKAYKRFKIDGDKSIKLTDIDEALSEVVRVYDSNKEKIIALEEYAKGRARNAGLSKETKAKGGILDIL